MERIPTCEALWPDYSANELGKSFSKMLLEKERSGSGYAIM